MPYPRLSDAQSIKLDQCVEKVMAEGHDKSSAIAMCRRSMGMSEAATVRYIDAFAYTPGQPFRVMPVGQFKRGERVLDITLADVQQMITNYEAGRPRCKIPIYAGHPTDANPDPPKVGNINRLFAQADGLYAEPEDR